MTDVVPLAAICAFVRANGGGDRAADWVAGRQLGVIDARQLHAAGLTRDAIATRRANGRLRPLHRGIYLVGPAAPLPAARELAALLACGNRSLISHRSAAMLWGLTEREAEAIDVTVIGHRRRRDGLRVHRVQTMHRLDRATKNGIRVTAPPRTLIDFASEAGADELDRAISEAFALRLVTERQISAAIARSPHRAGVWALKKHLADLRGAVISRSEAERRMRRLVAEAGLPAPEANVRVAGYEVDFVWSEQRLVLEIDGFAFHGHRAAFEQDRRRDAVLVAAGYRVIRVTWRQLMDEPFAVVARIAGALTADHWRAER